MKQRLLVALIGAPLVLIILIFLPPYATALYTTAICALGAYEMLSAAGAGQRRLAVILCILSSAAIQFCVLYSGYALITAVLLPFGLLLFVLWFAYYETERAFGFNGLGACLFAGFFVPLGLSAIIMLRKAEGGYLLVMLPVIATFLGDSGAFFAGKAFGKRKMSPKTSPNKTIEGLVGGLVTSSVFMALYSFVLRNFGLNIEFIKLLIIGLICGVAAQLGDLAFSLIKRSFGIKDYGRLLPGHGGAYDRYDSTTFAAPTALALLYLMGVL